MFLEPFSLDIKEKVDVGIPAFMYGTELSEVGSTKCAIPGFDYNKFYDIWSCPRLVMNVAVSIGLRYAILRFGVIRD